MGLLSRLPPSAPVYPASASVTGCTASPTATSTWQRSTGIVRRWLGAVCQRR